MRLAYPSYNINERGQISAGQSFLAAHYLDWRYAATQRRPLMTNLELVNLDRLDDSMADSMASRTSHLPRTRSHVSQVGRTDPSLNVVGCRFGMLEAGWR